MLKYSLSKLQADMVTPLALDWPVPTVQRLW